MADPPHEMIATVPCISPWQPWASLLFADGENRKVHETRTFPFPSKYFGERIAIHAAKRFPTIEGELHDLCICAFGPHYREALPQGAVIGTLEVDQWTATPFGAPASPADGVAGDWTPGRFAWRTLHSELLDRPVPYRGRQGWFRVAIEGAA